MSYQQDIRTMLEAVRNERGQTVSFDVAQVPNSFEMRVSVPGSSPPIERVFDLTTGFTPRTRKSIADWAVSIYPVARAAVSGAVVSGAAGSPYP